MTIINTNSISGISSITAQGSNGIEFYESSGVNQRLRIDGDGRLLVGATSSYGSANSDDLTIGDRTQSEVGITLGATVASAIRFADAGNVSAGMIQYVHNSGGTDYLNFYTNGANERLRITSDGNIGINDTSPSDTLTVYKSNIGNPAGITIRNTNASSTYSHARLRLESQNGAAYGEIWADVANAGLRLGYNSSSTVKIDSAGNIVLLNGKGIDFSATDNSSGTMSNELFDDYEEGTFTPQMSFSNLSVSSYSNAVGFYVKVGGIVKCNIYIRFSGADLSGTGLQGGSVSISGLPYAGSAGGERQYIGNPTAIGRLPEYRGTNDSTDFDKIYYYVNDNSSYLSFGVNKDPQSPITTDFLYGLSEKSFNGLVGQSYNFEFRTSLSYIVV